MNTLARISLMFWNMGIAAGLILGVMLILRPALCKLLTAQQRAWLGMLVVRDRVSAHVQLAGVAPYSSGHVSGFDYAAHRDQQL